MIDATDDEWADLNRRYREVFGEAIPTMELPADWLIARVLIEEAIATGDDGVFERGFPSDALN